MNRECLTIAQTSNKYGVSYRTLRFYEQRGILHPERNGTQRSYSSKDCLKIELVLKGKKLGFSLSEIEALASAGPRQAKETVTVYPSSPIDRLDQKQILEQINRLEVKRMHVEQSICDLARALSVRARA